MSSLHFLLSFRGVERREILYAACLKISHGVYTERNECVRNDKKCKLENEGCLEIFILCI